ncbi:MAG: ribosome-associated translation inhibitor RaiA [Proteobacteria bacterium]|nr:ribosome-associated translation inhibitor RaiA [Pseudomonadota bacterium]
MMMQYSFSFKHMEVSPYLEKYARKKIEQKMDKFLSNPREAKISFYTSKKEFGCHLYVGGDSYDYFVSASSPDMYTAVGSVLAKLESQLRRRKDKFKVSRQRGNKARKEVESLRA